MDLVLICLAMYSLLLLLVTLSISRLKIDLVLICLVMYSLLLLLVTLSISVG